MPRILASVMATGRNRLVFRLSSAPPPPVTPPASDTTALTLGGEPLLLGGQPLTLGA